MTWEVEFYHGRRRALPRYNGLAVTPAAAMPLAPAALVAEHPAGPPRRQLSLFQQAQRIGGQDFCTASPHADGAAPVSSVASLQEVDREVAPMPTAVKSPLWS